MAVVRGARLTLRTCEPEGSRAASVHLNGPWESVRGEDDDRAELAAAQGRLPWRQVTVPGPFMPGNEEVAGQTMIAWARRIFEITPGQAEHLEVSRWNRIAHP